MARYLTVFLGVLGLLLSSGAASVAAQPKWAGYGKSDRQLAIRDYDGQVSGSFGSNGRSLEHSRRFGNQSFYDLVTRAPDLTLFARLVAAANLKDLRVPQNFKFTLFAPDNAAFQTAASELGFDDANALVTALIKAGVAKNVVRYHLLIGEQTLGRLFPRNKDRTVTTQLGLDLTLTPDHKIVDLDNKTTAASLTGVDQQTQDGILYRIDNLLVPGVDFDLSATACQPIILGGLQATRCEFTTSTAFDPTPYTGPDLLMTIQAVGEAGQSGGTMLAPGGAGGRAQTTLPTGFYGTNPLYFYVAQNSWTPTLVVQGGAGGAASFVSTKQFPVQLTQGQVPASIVVAAGGGGGNGSNNNQAFGGAGGIAVAASSAVNGNGKEGGTAVYGSGAYFQNGGWNGGCGLTLNGSACAQNLFAWTAGVGGGTCTSSKPVLPTVTVGTLPWIGDGLAAGMSGHSEDGANACNGGGGGGGAGTAGGGGGYWSQTTNSGGGGGGGSFARDTAGTAVPAFAQKWIPTSDDSLPRVAITFYPIPTSPGAHCFDAVVNGKPVLQCRILSSTLPLDLHQLIADALGSQGLTIAATSVPVYLEAWGGSGGHGGAGVLTDGFSHTANGGSGGAGGYARSSFTVGSLLNLPQDLYVYIGANGSNGADQQRENVPAIGTPGGGGASTLILTAPLTTGMDLSNVVLIAGGGGGGGQGRAGAVLSFNGRLGRSGGEAIASDGSASSSKSRSLLTGSGGQGGCTRRAALRDRCGNDGIGGLGGAAESGRTGWLGTEGLTLTDGAGSNTSGGHHDGGAGGGGYGGGAAGPGGYVASLPIRSPGGGGGGGSYASASTIDDRGVPVEGADHPPSAATGGGFVLTFDVCAYDDTLLICTATGATGG